MTRWSTIVVLVLVAVLGPLSLTAQLNENCTVSILNRTARVDRDGSWRVDNVPATIGPGRARATCVENGQTVSGSTSFIDIVPGITNAFDAEIVLGVPDPVPDFLTISAPATTLDDVGATAQLTATATFIDKQTQQQTTADVTGSALGTAYTVSNSAFATVSTDGLVTAVSSGAVLISAMNDGALGVIQLQVTIAGGDSDGDGIPDDIEISVGLNPNDPTDALLDLDNDGLNNLSEFNLGTELDNPDSDGDGIEDGEETIAGTDGFVTNPLLADSDGDGIRDGLEIQTSTDPTDPASFDLAATLSKIRSVPGAFVLTFSVLTSGETFVDLAIEGELIDGFTIDLTSTALGTNYASSDLFICNFSAEDGRVIASADGGCVITVTNNGFSTEVPGEVRRFQPALTSQVTLPAFANNVDLNGDTAYVATGAAGLQVVDVTDRDNPQIIGGFDTPGNANDVKVSGTTVYIADGSAGLQIIDVADPTNPAFLGALDTTGEAWDVAVGGNRVYIADGAAGLQVIDITDPTSPQLLGTADTPGIAKGVAVSDSRQLAFVADGFENVQVVDTSMPQAPVIVGAGSDFLNADHTDITIMPDGTFGFTASADFFGFNAAFRGVDLSDPANPVLQTPPFTAPITDSAVAGDVMFAAGYPFTQSSGGAIPVYDVSTPATFFQVDSVNPDILQGGEFAATPSGIAADGAFLYVTANFGLLQENGTTGAGILAIGSYLPIEDNAGVPPTIDITAPQPGITAIEETTVNVTVDASDDVAVTAVVFLVDGVSAFVDTVEPYEFDVQVPIGASSLTLGAQALDLAANIGVASDVVVNVIPDPLTTITGRILDAGGSPISGSITSVFHEFFATSGGDGGITIANVPTIRGAVHVYASRIGLGNLLTGMSLNFDPVAGGTTDVGDVVLREEPASIYSGRTFSTDMSPVAIEVADFNGDGQLDVATANSGGGNSVSILLGAGNGLFQPEMSFATGFTPADLAVADLDGDGPLDLAVANEGADTISVLYGDGTGMFSPHEDFAVGDRPLSIAIADFDGDGELDIATANRNSSTVSIVAGNGSRTFLSQQTFSVGPFPEDLVVGSFNGATDTFIDIVTRNSQGAAANGLSLLLGNGDGTFQNAQPVPLGLGNNAFLAPSGLATADLNGDSRADLLTGHSGTIGLDLVALLANGDGTFQEERTPTLPFVATSAITTADVDGDGNQDAIVGNKTGSDSELRIWLGTGDGHFVLLQELTAGAAPGTSAVGDFDHDGTLDIVTANRTGEDVSLIRGNGDGTFFERLLTFDVGVGDETKFPNEVALVDMDGDGALDVVTGNDRIVNTASVSILPGNGDGSLQSEGAALEITSAIIPVVLEEVQSLFVADLNTDAELDILAYTYRGFDTADVSVFLADALGGFQPEQRFDFGQGVGGASGPAAVGDLNQDSFLDLVAANQDNEIVVRLGDGVGGFGGQLATSFTGPPESVAIGSLNSSGDAFPDIVVGASQIIWWMLGNGDGTFQPRQGRSLNSAIEVVGTADLNNDTIKDIVTANLDRSVSVLLGVGDGSFQSTLDMSTGSTSIPTALALADLNGDNFTDVILPDGSIVAVLLGNGDGTLQPAQRYFAHQQSVAGNQPSDIVAADLNNDGKPDLIAVNRLFGTIAVLLHQ